MGSIMMTSYHLCAESWGHPVGVQDSQAPALAAHPLFRHAAEVPHHLPLLDALVARLPVHNALRNALLTVSALHPHAVDDVALLRLVAHPAGLVRTGRP